MIYPVSQAIVCSVYATAVNDKHTSSGSGLYLSVICAHSLLTLFYPRFVPTGHEENDQGELGICTDGEDMVIIYINLHLTSSSLFLFFKMYLCPSKENGLKISAAM